MQRGGEALRYNRFASRANERRLRFSSKDTDNAVRIERVPGLADTEKRNLALSDKRFQSAARMGRLRLSRERAGKRLPCDMSQMAALLIGWYRILSSDVGFGPDRYRRIKTMPEICLSH